MNLRFFKLLASTGSLCGLAAAASAQTGGGFSLAWSTLDGGGGAASGGVFTVNGGFWPGLTGDSGGAPPALAIRLGVPSGGINTVILTWPHPSTGYVLQQTANMSASGGGWTDVTNAPVLVGMNQEVTLRATGNFCLFRLHVPPGETCATATELSPGATLFGQTTVGFQDNYSATASCAFVNCPGPDRFYSITIPGGQLLSVTVSPTTNWDPVVYLLSDCAAPLCLTGTDAN